MTLKAEHVSKHFTRASRDTNIFEALRDTSLTLENGTVTEICGRSGSGKSTLLNMLAGLLTPTTGVVELDGRDLYQLEDKELSELRNTQFGVIPQVHSALGSLTILENVLLPFTLYGAHGEKDTARDLLERLGILDLASIMPAELSGGEMRRMAIARALVRKPSVILADEPTGDLDDENTELVLRLLRETADEGAAVLLVTHETTAREYADRVFRMEAGALQQG